MYRTPHEKHLIWKGIAIGVGVGMIAMFVTILGLGIAFDIQ